MHSVSFSWYFFLAISLPTQSWFNVFDGSRRSSSDIARGRWDGVPPPQMHCHQYFQNFYTFNFFLSTFLKASRKQNSILCLICNRPFMLCFMIAFIFCANSSNSYLRWFVATLFFFSNICPAAPPAWSSTTQKKNPPHKKLSTKQKKIHHTEKKKLENLIFLPYYIIVSSTTFSASKYLLCW